jgi:hypothetical membrane protein
VEKRATSMKSSVALHRVSVWAGITAPIIFTALVIIESLLRPGYSQIYNNVSDLGAGPYAIIQNVNFIVFGILSIIFALGLGVSLPATREKAAKRVMWLVAIFGSGVMFAGVALLFIGVFPEDYVWAAHGLASVVAFFTIVAAQLLTWQTLRYSDGVTWGRYPAYSLVSGLLSLVLLFVFSYTSSTAYHGATERMFIVVPWMWIEVTGIKLNSLTKAKQSQENR